MVATFINAPVGVGPSPGRAAGVTPRTALRRCAHAAAARGAGERLPPGPFPAPDRGHPGRGPPAARCHTGPVVTRAVSDEIDRSADPVGGGARRSSGSPRAHPDAEDRLDAIPTLRAALIAVAAASPWLGRVCVTDPSALDVLPASMTRPRRPSRSMASPTAWPARLKRLGTAAHRRPRPSRRSTHSRRSAARLSDLAARLLQLAWQAAAAAADERGPGGHRAWASSAGASSTTRATSTSAAGRRRDASGGRTSDPRAFLDLARSAPGGSTWTCGRKGGPAPWPERLASYLAYWDRWAETWEFQALLKARPVAGDPALGVGVRRARRRSPGLGPPVRRRRAAPGPPPEGPGRAAA